MVDKARDVLTQRLEAIESDYGKLSAQMTALENRVNIVSLEQGHLKDLFTSQFQLLAKSNDVQLVKLDKIASDITTIATDADKTPAGRSLLAEIRKVTIDMEGQGKTLADHATWLNHVDGVLYLLKWLGAGGLAALVLSILRLLKVL